MWSLEQTGRVTHSNFVHLDLHQYGIAVYRGLQTVLLSPTFEPHAKAAGLDEAGLQEIVAATAAEPDRGDLILVTGGARKRRFGGRGKGKSGGYRTIHDFRGDDVPVFLLAPHRQGQASRLELG